MRNMGISFFHKALQESDIIRDACSSYDRIVIEYIVI